MAEEPGRRRASRLALAALLVGTGSLHFMVTSSYERIIPPVLGSDNARSFVLVSGAAQIAAGALLTLPRTRRLGAGLAAGLFVAVFPANVQMALDGGIAGAGFPLGSPVVAWLRLPLQVPLVWWALTLARRG
ncbi:membrane protein [soil metagenome]